MLKRINPYLMPIITVWFLIQAARWYWYAPFICIAIGISAAIAMAKFFNWQYNRKLKGEIESECDCGPDCDHYECWMIKHESFCISPQGHFGLCFDDPPHLYDPRPDPLTHPEYWRE